MTFRPDAVSRGLLILIFLLLMINSAKEFINAEPVPVTDFNSDDKKFIATNSINSSPKTEVVQSSDSLIQITSALPNKKQSDKKTKKDKKETQKIININTATNEELCTLNGIGEKMADKIIAYRKQNGRFKNIEDLREVKGIGEKKFEKIKSWIIVQ
jgi:competence protein ComEA